MPISLKKWTPPGTGDSAEGFFTDNNANLTAIETAVNQLEANASLLPAIHINTTDPLLPQLVTLAVGRNGFSWSRVGTNPDLPSSGYNYGFVKFYCRGGEILVEVVPLYATGPTKKNFKPASGNWTGWSDY